MDRPFWKQFGYNVLRVFARTVGILVFRLRCYGREHEPPSGGALICANHQSYFDPVVVGLCFERRLNYLARKSLFRMPLFRWLIEYLDAIPIDRDGFGLEGIKETLRRLRRGEMVLIFPEGTRTRDGYVQPIKPGFCSLARRGKVPLIPVGFDGPYDAWPRSALLPRAAKVQITIGQPITPEEIQELSDEQLIAELQKRMEDCFQQSHRRRQSGRVAASSPG